MTTRTSGVGASARSLIMVDGALLSPLIANNNNVGGPRWGMVSPEEIERVDVMYGPFSAAYGQFNRCGDWTSRPVCRSSLKQA